MWLFWAGTVVFVASAVAMVVAAVKTARAHGFGTPTLFQLPARPWAITGVVTLGLACMCLGAWLLLPV